MMLTISFYNLIEIEPVLYFARIFLPKEEKISLNKCNYIKGGFKMKRRLITMLCLCTLLVSGLAGCQSSKDPVETLNEDVTVENNTNSIAKEAPELVAKVAAGTLPPLEERLPVEADIMVENMESIGTYGGKLTSYFKGKGSQWDYGKMTEEPLFRFKNDGTIEPNVAKGYDVNADATEFIIYLREGMKWSDGVEFTAEDVVFFYDHMCVPETFGKSLWDCFYSVNPVTTERTPATAEKVDDYTVKFTFADPKPTFLENVAINAKWLFAPKHFYEQILPEFIGDEAAEQKAKEMGYSDVAAMGLETGYYYWNIIGRPTLRPWVTKNDPDSDLFVMERNPYYWKVDKEGKQLPYIDELNFIKTSDEQQNLLMVLSGDVDLALVKYSDITTLVDHMGTGGYVLTEWVSTAWSGVGAAFQLNQTVRESDGSLGKKSQLYQDIRFREALSIAVDRKEITNIVSDGFAKPTQASPPEGGMGYSKEWAEKWTEYDPKAAEALLVDIGMVKGNDGYYKFEDGSDFVLNIQTSAEESAVDKTAELVIKYWDEIGIKTTYRHYDRSLLEDMLKAGKHEALLAPISPMSSINPALRPDTIIPIKNYSAWYGDFGTWYATEGKEGVEPTGDVKEILNLYDKIRTSTTSKEVETYSAQILELHKKNIWEIGFMSDTPVLIAKNEMLKNFPDVAVYCDEFRGLGIAHLQKAYFAK
jgi:peptide/nickel transport system substrate-binding protein